MNMSSLGEGRFIGTISETSTNGDFEWLVNSTSDEVFKTDYFDSPIFSFSSTSWSVRLRLEERNSDGEKYISLRLSKDVSTFDKQLSYCFDIIFQGQSIAKDWDIAIFLDYADHAFFPEFIRYDNDDFPYYWSAERKISVQLIIKISLKTLVPLTDDLQVKKKGTGILSQNYKDLLLHSDDYDLVIKVKDKEFRAHRNIMQCRCPVFKSMLSHEMLEKSRGVVDIPDCDPSAFEQFLLHVYTGKVEVLDTSNMLNLYIIADKYNMDILKEECTAFIKKSLSVNVFTDVIKFASHYNDASLLEFATRYFVSNTKEILVSVEWQSFVKEFPTQANELFMKTYDQNSNRSVSRPKDDAEATDVDKKKRKFSSNIEIEEIFF